MNKLVLLAFFCLGLVLTGCALQLPAVNQPTANTAINTERDQAICENKCGDGVCQAIVCLATGCPCAETTENCPADCTE